MPDVTGNKIRAMLLPARRVEVLSSDSSYTEQSPVAGLASADRATRLRLLAGGTPTGSASIEVRCQHGGTPGEVDHGPSVATRRAGDLYWLGMDLPNEITYWEALTYDLSSQVEPTCCTMDDGTVAVAARTGTEIICFTRSPAGAISGPISVSDTGIDVYWPAIGAIGDTLYIVCWRRGRDSASTSYYLTVFASTDTGVTWYEAQNYATVEDDVYHHTPTWVAAGPNYVLGRIKWAYRDGQVIVLAHLTNDVLDGEAEYVRHWAGASLLENLDLVETVQGASLGWALPDVVATTGGFTVGLIERGNGVKVFVLGSAWQPLSTATGIQIPDLGSGSSFSQPGAGTVWAIQEPYGLAMSRDPSGIIWYHATLSDGVHGDGRAYAVYSNDDASKTGWSSGSLDPNAQRSWWYSPYDVTAFVEGNYPRQYATCWQRGHVVLAHNWHADVAGYDDSIALVYLGGMTDLALPYAADGVIMGDRASMLTHWLPFERPDDQNYAVISGGASSAALTAPIGALYLVTGDGAGTAGQHYYEWQGVAPATGWEIAIAEFEVDLVTDGATVTADVGVTLRLASNNHGVEMEICIDQTQVGVRDLVAGAPLAGSPFGGFVLGTRYEFRVGIAMVSDTGAGRNLQVWYRAADSSETRQWTRLGFWTLADDGGGGVDPYTGAAYPRFPRIRLGHIASSGAATQRASKWHKWGFNLPDNFVGSQAGTWATWHDLNRPAGDNPELLPGRPLGSALIHVLDGVEIAGRRGPAEVGDSWSIAISGEYDITRATSHDLPTPRVGWRSIDDASDSVIAWPADPDRPDVEDSDHAPLLGLYLGGINFRRAQLDAKVGGAWVLVTVIDTRILSGVSYIRRGLRLQASAPGSQVYLSTDELAGCTAEWDDGAGTTVRRRLSGNYEGRWSNSTSEPIARLDLESTSAGDPTSGGTLSVWSRDVVVLVAGRQASAWRLTIDSAYPTADGDHRIGSLLWGPVDVMAMPPSWGRSIEQEAGHAYQEVAGRVSVRRDEAPARQVVRLSWSDGIDTTEIYVSDEVRWVRPGPGLEPSGALAATPTSLQGALQRHAGRPVVYLPTIDASVMPQVVVRHREAMLATIESGPVIESMLGDEEESEAVRIATLELAEVR